MNFDDLVRACSYLHNLASRYGWGTQPLITFRFATIGEYARAKADLCRELTTKSWYFPAKTMETIDIYGVEVRLECTEMMATPNGPIYAVEALRNGRIVIAPIK